MLIDKYTVDQIREAVERRNASYGQKTDPSEYDEYIECERVECTTCEELEQEWILPHLPTTSVERAIKQIETIRQEAYDAGRRDGYVSGFDAAANQYDIQYELFIVHYPHEARMICGHSDPFWLIHRAAQLSSILVDMSPNISFEIRDRDGNIECRLNGETGQIDFRGEQYLNATTG